MKYEIRIDRTGCIACANCYIMDQEHFEGDDEGYSMVVGGEINPSISKGNFDDDYFDYVQEVADMCPVDVISVKKL